jgi:hypothetical protein
VRVDFNKTRANSTFTAFSDAENCVPTVYTTIFGQGGGGNTTFTDLGSGTSFTATFTSFNVTQDATGSPTTTTINGSTTSGCTGNLSLVTPTNFKLQQVLGTRCYTGGRVEVTQSAIKQTVIYNYQGNGSVGLDTNNDGNPEQTYQSCLDPALVACS